MALLFDLIRDLPQTGGFSYDLATGRTADHGYMVALTGHTVQIPITSTTSELVAAVYRYISEHASIFVPSIFLGGWVENGQLWLEPSRRVDNLAVAFDLGPATDPIAIFAVLA